MRFSKVVWCSLIGLVVVVSVALAQPKQSSEEMRFLLGHEAGWTEGYLAAMNCVYGLHEVADGTGQAVNIFQCWGRGVAKHETSSDDDVSDMIESAFDAGYESGYMSGYADAMIDMLESMDSDDDEPGEAVDGGGGDDGP